MLKMEYLYVVCAIKCAMAAILNPNFLKSRISRCQYKSNCHLELNVL